MSSVSDVPLLCALYLLIKLRSSDSPTFSFQLHYRLSADPGVQGTNRGPGMFYLCCSYIEAPWIPGDAYITIALVFSCSRSAVTTPLRPPPLASLRLCELRAPCSGYQGSSSPPPSGSSVSDQNRRWAFNLPQPRDPGAELRTGVCMRARGGYTASTAACNMPEGASQAARALHGLCISPSPASTSGPSLLPSRLC